MTNPQLGLHYNLVEKAYVNIFYLCFNSAAYRKEQPVWLQFMQSSILIRFQLTNKHKERLLFETLGTFKKYTNTAFHSLIADGTTQP